MTNPLIEDLVKHRRGMLLVDKILSYDECGLIAEVVIKKGNSFLSEGYVPAWIGIEYVAQAVAAWGGLQAIQDDKGVKIGLLLSCRKYKSTRSHFMLGEVLKINIREIFVDGQMGSYSCIIYDEAGEEIVTAYLSAFMPENVEEIKGIAI